MRVCARACLLSMLAPMNPYLSSSVYLCVSGRRVPALLIRCTGVRAFRVVVSILFLLFCFVLSVSTFVRVCVWLLACVC